MRRGEVAWLMPKAAPSEVRFGTPDELAAELEGLGASVTSVLLVGDGALRYRERLEAGPGQVVFAGPELAAPPVASLAVLAFVAMQLGQGRDPGRSAPSLRPGGGRPHQLELASRPPGGGRVTGVRSMFHLRARRGRGHFAGSEDRRRLPNGSSRSCRCGGRT